MNDEIKELILLTITGHFILGFGLSILMFTSNWKALGLFLSFTGLGFIIGSVIEYEKRKREVIKKHE